MRFYPVLTALLAVMFSFSLSAQITIGQQDFETSPAAPVLTFSNTSGSNSSGSSSGSANPANSPLFTSGSRGWQAVNQSSVVTFANQSIIGFTNTFLTFRLAGMSVNSSNGIDNGDLVTVAVSTDGGTTYSNEMTITSTGSNVRWPFSATGVATATFDGNNVPTAFTTAGGSSGISTVTLNFPNGLSQVRVRITLTNNENNERWVMDDVRIRGTQVPNAAVLSDLAPQVPAQFVFANSTNNDLFQFSLLAGNTISVTGLTCTTAGNYDAADVLNLKVVYSTDVTFDLSDVVLSTLTNPGAAGLKTFPSFTAQTIANGVTGHFFITADFASGAESAGNTININALTTANFTIASGTKGGSTTSAGTQTILPDPVKEVVFTEADADGNEFEFMTLTRLDLSNWRATDNGIFANGSFRTGESIYSFPTTGLSAVPAGTFIRVHNAAGTNDLDFSDGIVSLYGSPVSPSGSGEQVILYVGTNTFKGGINWGNSGWVADATNGNDSRAPFTGTDFAPNTTLNDIEFVPASVLVGTPDQIISTAGLGVRNFGNWIGNDNGTENTVLIKNIQLNQNDYSSGSVAVSGITTTQASLNLSSVNFGATTADTRYMVVINGGSAPSSPTDRYTCYSSVSGNFSTAPNVVASVTGQGIGANGTSSCGTPTVGAGKVVYFDYTLPSALLLSNLASGVTYEVRVFAVNGNGVTANVGVPNPSGSFTTLNCPNPSTASSNLSFSNITTTGLTLSWTAGNGTSRIVLIRQNAEPTAAPVDGVSYTANSSFNAAPVLGDARILFIGTGNSVNVTDLTPGGLYFFEIFEFSCSGGFENYATASAVSSAVVPPSNVALTTGCPTNTTQSLSWSYGTGTYDEVAIFVREGAAPTSPSMNAVMYVANTNYAAATAYGNTGRCVYKGTGTSTVITGLTPGVSYFITAFTNENYAVTIWSSGTTITVTPAMPNVTGANAFADNGAVNLNWSNPTAACFDEVLVVANTGTVTLSPTGNGSTYVANTVYTSSNQIVYKGTATAVTVTNLTNGTSYCFKIFTRKGTEWSTGIEVCATPSAATAFEEGDIAVVAINTQAMASGNADEVCFTTFKEITAGTSFFLNDNGFERAGSNTWGDTEGVIRITRNTGASTVAVGTSICIIGPLASAPFFEVYVCGVLDNANWQIDPNVIGTGAAAFDLDATDQLWITQGGAWTNPAGSNDVMYNGKVLYGWTGIDWKTNIGSSSPAWSTAGSRLIPGTECFTVNTTTLTNSNKVKYTGAVTSTTRLGWIARVNNPTNWTAYASNTAFDAAPAAYNYANACVIFPVSASSVTAGRWTGEKNTDWFDCANWEDRMVPDATTNVIVATVAGLNSNANINFDASAAYLYGGIANCNDLTITNKQVQLTGNASDKLMVSGNLTLNGGVLLMSDGTAAADGELQLKGNWSNNLESNFVQGDGVVRLVGNTVQTIQTADATEIFNILSVENSAGAIFAKPLQVTTELRMLGGNIQNGSQLLTLGNLTGTQGTLTYSSGRIIGSFNRRMNATGTEYLFPIGTATNNRFARFNFSNISAGNLTLSFIESSPALTGLPLLDANTSVEDIFTEGYWSTSIAGGLASISYTLSLDAVGFSSHALNSSSRLVRRSTAGSWAVNGSHLALSGSLVRRQGLSQFGEFGVATGRDCVTSLSGPSIPSQSVCTSQQLLPVSVTPANGTGPFSYQWFNNPVNSNANGFSLGSQIGGQTNTLTPPVDAESSIYYYVQVSQTGSVCPVITSSTALISVAEVIAPTVSISASSPSVCSGGVYSFSSSFDNAGVTPLYQWFRNGSPISGATSLSYSSSSLSDGDIITLRITSTAFCTNGQQVFSDPVSVVIVTPQMFYPDADGDGYPSSAGGILTCNPPAGYTTVVSGDINSDGLPDFDTNDNNEDINPEVEEYCNGLDDDSDGQVDEGFSPQTFYADLDADGFGNPNSTVLSCEEPEGYVSNASDCNDNDANIRPGATEVCDGVDNDCDGIIDEGCGVTNDQRSNATLLPLSAYGNCNFINGTLVGASPSAEAQTTVIGGQDVWYYFTATSPGISVTCNTTVTNVCIELQDNLGALINVENVNTGVGSERLNYNGLVNGQTYFVCIRNANSTQGANGVFQLCAQRLLASSLESNANAVNPCATIKATWTNANQYIFNVNSSSYAGLFAAQAGGSNNTILSLSGIPGITYSNSYTVSVDALYALTDGMGNGENIIISGVVSGVFTTTQQPSLQLRVQDSCPNQVTASTWVRADPQLCGGVINYEWEFTRVLPTPASAVTALRNANDRLWRVSWIPGGAQPGATYNVRVRPIFTGNVPGTWSTVASCLRIAGGSGMATAEPQLETSEAVGFQKDAELRVYPNPISSGMNLTIFAEGFENGWAQLELLDAYGKLLLTEKLYIDDEGLTFELPLSASFASGLYVVRCSQSTTKGQTIQTKTVSILH